MATDLPRLNLAFPITKIGGTPKYEFHVSWDKVMSTINSIEDDVDTLQADVAAINPGSWIPLVTGAEPAVLVTDGAGVLLLVAGP